MLDISSYNEHPTLARRPLSTMLLIRLRYSGVTKNDHKSMLTLYQVLCGIIKLSYHLIIFTFLAQNGNDTIQ